VMAREARSAVQDTVRMLAVMRERHGVYAQRQAETDSRLASLNETASQVSADLAEAEARETIARETLATLQDPGVTRDRVGALRLPLAEKRGTQATQQSGVDQLLHAAAARRTRLEAVGVEERSWHERAEAAARQQAALEERRLALAHEIE